MPIGLWKTRCCICYILALVCIAEGFTTPTPAISPTKQNAFQQHTQPKSVDGSAAIIPNEKSIFQFSNIDFRTPTKQLLKMVQTATESTTLSFVLSTISTSIAAPTQPALSADNQPATVRSTLPKLSPSPLRLKARSLPIVGGFLANRFGTADESAVKTPENALVALSSLKGESTDVVDMAMEGGEETAKIRKSIIPTLSFQKSPTPASVAKGIVDKLSDWVKVENMGNGETYYFNEKTFERQFEMPATV